jgi:hypothetical protein
MEGFDPAGAKPAEGNALSVGIDAHLDKYRSGDTD